MTVRGLFVAACALAGFAAGILVTRYAPECTAGLCWGQSPFVVMFLGGVLATFLGGSRLPAGMPPVAAGVLAGAVIGICVSLGGGVYAFLGGPMAFARPAPVMWMALLPNPLIGMLGGAFGLIGAAVATVTQLCLDRLRARAGDGR